MFGSPPSFAICAVLVLAAQIAVNPAAAAGAAETRVAVAANFAAAAGRIGALFEQETGHRAVFSYGSTGQLYAQISQAAPFDVFLAADQDRPREAVEAGFASPGSRFTYATGRIVLFSPDETRVDGAETLRRGRFSKIAIANPVTAPYGAAAVEAMKALGVYESLAGKIVQGGNIAQAYEFVQTGNAEVGFVALSQVVRRSGGSRWVVPEALYTTIAQDAVLLKHGADNEAARAFLVFLQGPAARAVLDAYGYGAGG